MSWLKTLMGSILCTLSASVTAWWACDFIKIGPADTLTNKVSDLVSQYRGIQRLSEITIAGILEKLANCRTRAQADTAIRLLLDKTGVKHPSSPLNPAPQSEFGVFHLSNDAIAKLAAWHLSFVAGRDTVHFENKIWKVDTISAGETYGSLAVQHQYIDRELELKGDLDQALSKLQQSAEAALRDPELPENALLVTIIAEGALIPPKTPPLFTAKTLRSPVQNFVLALWLTVEFGELKATPVPVLKRHLCLLHCYADFALHLLFCRFEPNLQAREACLKSHASDFFDCMQGCFHDQGGGGGR
ncbi:MAG: hypothetical protein ACREOO_01760 [bacterium]